MYFSSFTLLTNIISDIHSSLAAGWSLHRAGAPRTPSPDGWNRVNGAGISLTNSATKGCSRFVDETYTNLSKSFNQSFTCTFEKYSPGLNAITAVALLLPLAAFIAKDAENELPKRMYLLLVAVFACSCATHKHRYLQVPKDAQSEAIYQKTFEDYRLQPNDNLYINVAPEKEDFAGMFNISQRQTTSTTMSGTYLYLQGYPIDIMGYIEIPLIGKLQVAGLTIAEVEKL